MGGEKIDIINGYILRNGVCVYISKIFFRCSGVAKHFTQKFVRHNRLWMFVDSDNDGLAIK